jgi:hypothetical protein
LLTGSAAWGTISSRSDIDIIFVSTGHDVVSYRYYMPDLTGVAIRTEVGRIPISYLEKVLASGYSDEISTGLKEQISNARVLFGDTQVADQMISKFSRLKPKKKLLGEYLFQATEALANAKQALARASLVEAILSLDRFSRSIWRLLLVVRHNVGVQKDKHEMKAARAVLAPAEMEDYQVSGRIAGLDRQAALSMLLASQKVISKTFDLVGVDVSIVGDVEEK